MKQDKPENVIGVAWYRPEQWQRLLEIAEDTEKLTETYEEWLSEVENAIRTMAAKNVSMEKVDVDVEEILAWCNGQGLPMNGEARSRYVAKKLRDRDG